MENGFGATALTVYMIPHGKVDRKVLICRRNGFKAVTQELCINLDSSFCLGAQYVEDENEQIPIRHMTA